MNRREKTSDSGKADRRQSRTNHLVRRCLDGETGCFEELVREHQAAMFALACTMMSGAEDAKDVTQDSFVKAYTKLKGFKQEYPFRGWIQRITYHTCIDHLRKRNNMVNYIKRKSREWTGKNNPGYTLVEHSELFSPHLKKLNPRERAILLMRYDQSLSNIEIGKIIGCSSNTVSVHLFHARKKLKGFLREGNHQRPVSSVGTMAGSAAGGP